ncbi:MAG: hypothetical protein DRJ63_03960 [Thermoprotei archaeon]|nr:MAG: hypothetical protein DRJ63_03960 [Thermoprotei archaeon]
MKDYLVVRTHGLKSRLLTKKNYEDLVYSRASLAHFGYLEAPEEHYTLHEILDKITQKYIQRIEFLSKTLTETSNFFKMFLEELEIENIKAKIRSIYGSREKKGYLYPYSHFISLTILKRAATLYELEKLLEKTPLKLPLRKLAKKNPQLPLLALDSLYYILLKNSLKVSRDSRKEILELINYESLIKLLYWILVIGKENLRNREILSILKSLYPKERALTISLESLATKLKLDYNKIINNLKLNKISEILLLAESNLIKRAKHKALFNAITAVYVYYYMLLCRNERRNLEKIIIGRELKLSPQVILSSLIYPP